MSDLTAVRASGRNAPTVSSVTAHENGIIIRVDSDSDSAFWLDLHIPLATLEAMQDEVWTARSAI